VRREERLDKKTVRQLVKLYRSAPGADDAVGPEFERRGAQARDELIQMLDTMPAADLGSDTAETIEKLLQQRFPSAESAAALERLQSRYPGTLRGSGDLWRLTMLRAELSGLWNEGWEKEHQALPAEERDLHSCELLLASARPGDRVVFLVRAANSALRGYYHARRENDPIRQSATAIKAEKFAREILAIPDLASKSGDGVYTGNLVLGMLANDRGNIEEAKRHLIEASKTPGSWSLNRVPGPNWWLAIALLERGEREVVCEFLDNVKVFTEWPPAPTPPPMDGLLERWKKNICAGEVPTYKAWVDEWFEWSFHKKRRPSIAASLKLIFYTMMVEAVRFQ
jgi:hypothetical protein